MLKTSNMQSAVISNRFIIGIVAFGVSFGLSLVLKWDFNQAFLTGIITIPATYFAAFFVDKRRRYHEMLVLDSLGRRIKDLEGMKFRLVTEIKQLEAHSSALYTESTKLQTQVTERRSQRDSLNRELSTFVGEKQQLEVEINYLETEIQTLEKTKADLNQSFSNLAAEKRRLELTCNISRAEITQLQTHNSELLEQKRELESNLTLLNRLKPQLEEKLYELRVEIQELEDRQSKQSKLLLDATSERESIEASLNSLKTQLTEQQTELSQLKEQIVLLQEERDQLQNQVWELLQQMETLSLEQIPDNSLKDSNDEVLSFSDLNNSQDSRNFINTQISTLPEEWNIFLAQLPKHEVQILKALIGQENPNIILKKIAEENITMPHLLIDSINERANDILGELIINPYSEPLGIYQEHLLNLKKMIFIYDDRMTKQTSSK
jgi:DNA repair exonuclease SbcCD ATPase subunit